jgi:hypothetical protein
MPGVPPPGQPVAAAGDAVLLINPRSGGGKAECTGPAQECRVRGVEPIVLGSEEDPVALAEAAVARGADVRGMAGGDGSLGLVAGVAARHGVAMVVVPAGTRNHRDGTWAFIGATWWVHSTPSAAGACPRGARTTDSPDSDRRCSLGSPAGERAARRVSRRSATELEAGCPDAAGVGERVGQQDVAQAAGAPGDRRAGRSHYGRAQQERDAPARGRQDHLRGQVPHNEAGQGPQRPDDDVAGKLVQESAAPQEPPRRRR